MHYFRSRIFIIGDNLLLYVFNELILFFNSRKYSNNKSSINLKSLLDYYRIATDLLAEMPRPCTEETQKICDKLRKPSQITDYFKKTIKS